MEKHKKKVLYIWKSPYPWDVRVEKICKSLSKKYDVMILARWGGENKRTEYIDGIKVRRVGFKKNSKLSTPVSFNPYWKYEIERAINDYLPNLIIVREIMLGTVSGKLAKKYNIPIAMDMAENYPAIIKEWDNYKNSLLKRFLFQSLEISKRTEKNSLKYMNNVFVVCEENKDRLYEEYSYDDNKTVVIRNTPALNSYETERDFSLPIKLGYHGYINTERNLFKFLAKFQG